MTVHIAMSADANYIAPLAATIQSIVDCSDENRDYSILVMEDGIAERHKELILGFLPKNFRIDFLAVKDDRFDRLFVGYRSHIRKQSYYRLILPDLLAASKVVYTDVDVIFKRDIAELYDTDMEDYLVAAVHEGDGYIMAKKGIEDVEEYWKAIGVEPENFFYSGNIVLNLDALREVGASDKMMELAASRDWLFHDLDVMNVFMQGKAKFVDARWCCMVEPAIDGIEPFDDISEAYYESLKEPWQIHYGGAMKPWAFPTVWEGKEFWDCVKQTPFLDEAVRLGNMVRCQQLPLDQLER